MQYIPEILKIIEGGVKNNATQLTAYANLLADKLEKDGLNRPADSIRKKLLSTSTANSFGLSAVGNAVNPALPVDRDSRLTLGDESMPLLEKNEVQLPKEVESTVNEFLAFIDKAQLLTEAGVGITPSMIIYGPPGCGKTQLAKCIAAKLELPLITARCDTLISSFLGSTSKNLRSLFDHAASRPCVLFLDEFDAFAKARDDQHELGELKRVVVSLLQNIDALPDNTILLAATNHEELLDPAVWRRFAYRVQVSLPNVETRKALIKQFLGSYQPDNVKPFLDVTEDMSGAIIEQTCHAAIRHAVIAGESKVDIEYLVIKLIQDQYQNVLRSNIGDEEKVLQLRLSNKKLFTMSRLATLLGMSVGKISKIVSQKEDVVDE